MKRRNVAALGLVALVAALIPAGTSHTESAPSLTRTAQSTPAARLAPVGSLAQLPTGLPPIHVAPSTPAPAAALYEPGQRMVRVTDPMDLDDVLAQYDVQLLREPVRSGLALVSGDDAALAALGDDPRVTALVANGRTHGASDGSVTHLQWHIDQVDAPHDMPNAEDYTVAVLDTGVAYETATRLGVSYARAPSLASSPIVAPYDFINDDPYANDDHQHGTHIASLIASDGAVRGSAPGVGLMPVKVLDEHNTGTEYALLEGILHAVHHDADVINMSLSFGEGYVPSTAIIEAIEEAHEAGVVMVAASGNQGSNAVSFPASHPYVIAVGSSRKLEDTQNNFEVADYSNISGAIDVLAPGGDITEDRNGDGLVDGVLAEAINPSDPTDVGYWLMAGTSQASAMVAGAAVQLRADGIPHDEVFIALQDHGRDGDVDEGTGGGSIDLDYLDIVVNDKRKATFYVSMVPYLRPAYDDRVRAVARFTAFDEDGNPAEDLDIIASIWGENGGLKECNTGSDGQCEIKSGSVLRNDSSGNSIPRAWTIAVECVEHDASDLNNIGYKPLSAMTATPAFQDLVATVQANGDLQDAVLAWSWTRTDDDELGEVDPALSVVDSGSGLASIPLGLVMTPGAVKSLGTFTPSVIDVDGDPVQIGLVHLDGSGLASIPLGLRRMKLLTIDGSGLASIPLGLRARDALGGGRDLFPMDGSGLASIPLGLRSSPLGRRLDDGGWRVEGYAGASALGGSSELGIMPEAASTAYGVTLGGSGAGSLQLLP